MAPRHGSLCTGYGGLDMATQAVFGGELVWWADIEPGPIAVMRRHHPDLPNLGDIRTVDWAAVPRVDLLTAGYPCQPFSNAGKRQGLDDPRHIWPYIAEGIGVLRPGVIILENVAGHLRRGFDVVCQDLAALGYDAVWTVVRAADVGAPHRRERLFVLATDTARERGDGSGDPGARRGVEHPDGHRPAADATGTAAADECDYCGCPVIYHDEGGFCAGPCGGNCASERWGRPAQVATHAQGDGRDEQRPAHEGQFGGSDAADDRRSDLERWAEYAAAVERWEHTLGRAVPEPTTTGARGARVLSPVFVEWMMGLPVGWVTATEGLSRNQMLKLIGNGVVPQQAEYAIRLLLTWLAIHSVVAA